MTVATTGAVSHENVEGWHSIDWQAAHENVRRLQARIVKATQAGRWGKVQALQRLLTRSYSAKVLAVRRVTENSGKRTPGVDGELWDTPRKKMDGVHRLRQRGYKPLPLRRLYIPKTSGSKKLRPLSIPTLRDRAMQALYLLALEPVAETTADPNSYGFRKERNCADAVEQCFKAFAPKRAAQWFLEADIQACFDTISHDWLLAHIPLEKLILHKWLKAGYMEQSRLHPTDEGTPQGGVISPVLANMTLDGLESRLLKRYPSAKRGVSPKVCLVRYADDFIVSGGTRELLENEVQPLIAAFLAERGLRLSPEKTLITHIDDGFDFLAQNVRKYKGKMLIQPSKKSQRRLLNRVNNILKGNPQVKAGHLVVLLNPVLRGWANYHRHICSKKTFAKLDHLIFRALWRWAKRRHPNKGRKWVRHTYFKTVGGNHWTFSGAFNGRQYHLYALNSTPIRRHSKIVGAANPFDPAWEVYFEQRLGLKMVETLHGRKQLVYLWKEQNGICPVCQQKITKLTGWHNHHIVWRTHGGADTAENRVLLHPTCHQQVHHLKLTVEKPRPARQGVGEA